MKVYRGEDLIKALCSLKIGDIIKIYENDNIEFVVRHVSDRYGFASTYNGVNYVILDFNTRTIATLKEFVEAFKLCKFNKEGNAEKVDSMLKNGELHLSNRNKVHFDDVAFKNKGNLVRK